MCHNNIDEIDAKLVFDAAKKGDKAALRIVHYSTDYIGIALANVVNLMDIDLILLEGGLSRAGNILTDNIYRSMEKRLMKYSNNKIDICVSELRMNATALGAGTLVLKQFVENGGLHNKMEISEV